MQTTMCLGHVRRRRIWEATFKKCLEKKDLQVVMHLGTKYRGKVEALDRGWAPGVMKMESVGSAGVSDVADVGSDSGDSATPKHKFDTGRKNITVSPN